ncbi:MAG: hypothetical protein PWQ61_3514 [Betaproteobacteria bacterium]|nr:hypothetical protein [Betaproteobacteria bacterium]
MILSERMCQGFGVSESPKREWIGKEGVRCLTHCAVMSVYWAFWESQTHAYFPWREFVWGLGVILAANAVTWPLSSVLYRSYEDALGPSLQDEMPRLDKEREQREDLRKRDEPWQN